MIKIALQIGRDLPKEHLLLAKQFGVDEIVGSAPQDLYEGYMYGRVPQGEAPTPEVWQFERLVRMKNRIEDAGLKISIIDTAPPIDKVKLGLPGRDKQIENFCTSIKNMGAAGINRITFNFTPLRTTRTSTTTRTRGRAQVTSFDMSQMENAPFQIRGYKSVEDV